MRTEWAQYTLLDYGKIYESCQRPAFVFDGRNLLDHDALRKIGFQVFGIGKALPKSAATKDEEAAVRDKAAAARIAVGAAKQTTFRSLVSMGAES